MKLTKILMGMPITIEIADQNGSLSDIENVFQYFQKIDTTFSTYKPDSEISRFNTHLLKKENLSLEVQRVLDLCEQTKKETQGYFEIMHNGKIDPSGLVKGWAIAHAADIIKEKGYTNFYVEAGGDIQVKGRNPEGNPWQIGIRNPFNLKEIVKVVEIGDQGIATSGTYIRGQHIYNPHDNDQEITGIVSLTVIGPNIYDADRYATAAFAMGKVGISFIESLPRFEGYQIDVRGVATYTSNFNKYLLKR